MVNIVLSSGGYDSTVLLAWCKNLWKDKKVEYYLYHCCLIDDTVKSETSDFEIINEAETKLFIENNNEPIINSKLHLLKENSYDDFGGEKRRSSYIPARNSLLVLDAINKFYATHDKDEELTIFIGLIKTNPTFPDGNAEWLVKLNDFLKVEFKGKVTVLAPFLDYDKDYIYKVGCSLGVDLNKTFSCNYEKDGKECGKCGNCVWRKKHTYPNYRRLK